MLYYCSLSLFSLSGMQVLLPQPLPHSLISVKLYALLLLTLFFSSSGMQVLLLQPLPYSLICALLYALLLLTFFFPLWRQVLLPQPLPRR